MEQKIKLYVKTKENMIETFNKLTQAYRDEVLSRTEIFRWYKAVLETGHFMNYDQLIFNQGCQPENFFKSISLLTLYLGSFEKMQLVMTN